MSQYLFCNAVWHMVVKFSKSQRVEIFRMLFLLSTAQKMKISIKDFVSKCDQIHRKLWIWSHLLTKSLMGNFIVCAVITFGFERTSKLFFWIRFYLSFTTISEFGTDLRLITRRQLCFNVFGSFNF